MQGDPIGPHPERHPWYVFEDQRFYCRCFCYLCWDGEKTICIDESWIYEDD